MQANRSVLLAVHGADLQLDVRAGLNLADLAVTIHTTRSETSIIFRSSGGDDGDAGVLVHAAQQLDDLGAGAQVQVTGGLSARIMAGSLAKERAMATRCCWPPESSGRFVMDALAQAHGLRSLIPSMASSVGVPAKIIGRVTFSRAADRDQVERLEDVADLAAAQPG